MLRRASKATQCFPEHLPGSGRQIPEIDIEIRSFNRAGLFATFQYWELLTHKRGTTPTIRMRIIYHVYIQSGMSAVAE